MRESYYEEYFRLEDTHWWFLGRRRILLSLMDRHVGAARDGEKRRILDFGCGTGAMLSHLQRYGAPLGADTDEQALEFCRSRGIDAVQLLDGRDLPFAEGSFAVVTAFDVLEHVEDDLHALREIARVLEPNGLLMIAVPAHQWMWGRQDEINHHFRRYGRRELEARLAQAGFVIERTTYFNAIFFVPIAAIRLARRLVPARGELRSDFPIEQSTGLLNDLLTRIFGGEARFLKRRDLPIGVSITAVARKPAANRRLL